MPARVPSSDVRRSGGDGSASGSPGRDPGSLLLGGKYRLESPLAAGGMGTVWLATHVTLGRAVAVKFIDVRSHDRERTEERFLREARLAATIHHPNVIDVVDFGIAENGEPVMVMELLEGQALSSRMAALPGLTTNEVVHVMSQVLAALDAVHRAGILHCDMKPANVVLGTMSDVSDIFAWLIDFGIAYSLDPSSELRRGRFGTDLHLITGTPEYMAPEQAEGRTDLDERVDVYAASVMLYEMLAGTCPFVDEHPGRVVFKVIDGKHVPLRMLRPDIPELAEVVAAGMSHDRTQRPSSAKELRRLLLDASGRTEVTGSVRSLSLRPGAPSGTPRSPSAAGPSQRSEAPTLARAPEEPPAERVDDTKSSRPWVVPLVCALGVMVLGGIVYGAATRSPAPVTARSALVPSVPTRDVPPVAEVPRVTPPAPQTFTPAEPAAEAAAEPAVESLPDEPVTAASEEQVVRDEPRAPRVPRPSAVVPEPAPLPEADEPERPVDFIEDPGF